VHLLEVDDDLAGDVAVFGFNMGLGSMRLGIIGMAMAELALDSWGSFLCEGLILFGSRTHWLEANATGWGVGEAEGPRPSGRGH
jgi:hypothetical protein